MNVHLIILKLILIQVQCLCEALQQKGDVEKLATFLWSLPTSDLFRTNESVLRFGKF